ncbi:hypothetical protein [Alcaligenes faecalis]|uniref:Uncharacterized protein n=1 Tax=Alcaligenes faecalis TaxID=511 RepID=A0ABY7N3P3_ALCFA|nr:hypothetical protein [Alcaligenes faecalis]WBM38696.1 hypothetical protein M2J83_02340 [Alcaligenes faecalis]
MSFIPSCDDREDAIRSLSEIYRVSTENIENILQASEILEISQIYSEINSPHFLFLVCCLLKASPRDDITHACYYHSTSYNGSSSWFDEGLLGSSQGVEHFLDKITDLIPPEKQLLAKQKAKRIVKLRSEYESSTAETCGPYAWDTLTAARFSLSGVRYRIPEAIQDLFYPSFCGNGVVVDLRGIIEKHLKPVVVKFKGKISDIDKYCTTLWAYLLSDGECHLVHTFLGNGQTIPKEDIVALLDVRNT